MDLFQDILNVQTTDPEQVQSVEESWVHIIKIIIVCGKVAFISTMLTLAILAYNRKDERLPNKRAIIALMVFKILILVGLMILDFTTQYIAAFFLLSIGSCFCTFCVLQITLGDVHTQSGASLRKKFCWYPIVMVSLYIVVFGLSFSQKYGAYCNHAAVYPLIMQSIPIIFCINSAFAIWLKYKNYYLEWDEKENHLLHAESNLKLQDMFEARMNTYVCYQYIIAPAQIIIFFIGRFAVGDNTEFLGCYEGGNQWKYHSVWGSLFTFLLIASCFMQAVLLEKVLYSIPHHMGYFEVDAILENASKERPKSGSARGINDEGDDYVNANNLA